MPADNRVQTQPGRVPRRAARRRAGRPDRPAPKTLPPKYFYDARGSELFDEITRLPEYYLTRAETAILERHAADIAALSQCESLVELGSGTSAKTRLLLRAHAATAARCASSCPFDVDPAVLTEASEALSAEYPGLRIAPFLGDFEPRPGRDPGAPAAARSRSSAPPSATSSPPSGPRSWPRSAPRCGRATPSCSGTDLVKDTGRLLRAYDDAAGVTAEFNRNVLRVINRELDADFAVEEFEHVAVWNADCEWIEMRLRSARDQQVTISALDLTVSFAAGEQMRTEISAKFRRERIEAELAAAGLKTLRFWTDPDGDFGLTLAQAPE